MSCNWTPTATTTLLGDLPLKVGEIATYEVRLTDVDTAPSEILVYAFISLEDTASSFHRGYYTVYTQKLDGTQFKFYMNVAMTKDAVINSENFWLPYGQDFEPRVYVTLSGPHGAELKPKKKIKTSHKDGTEAMKAYRHQHPRDEDVIIGQAMITG